MKNAYHVVKKKPTPKQTHTIQGLEIQETRISVPTTRTC